MVFLRPSCTGTTTPSAEAKTPSTEHCSTWMEVRDGVRDGSEGWCGGSEGWKCAWK